MIGTLGFARLPAQIRKVAVGTKAAALPGEPVGLIDPKVPFETTGMSGADRWKAGIRSVAWLICAKERTRLSHGG